MYERTYTKRVLKAPAPVPRSYVVLKRVLIGLAIGLVVTGVVVCLRYPRFQIQTVAIEGAFVITPTDIEQFVHKELTGKYLRIIPKTSIFLLSPKKLGAQISTAFPYVQTIRIERTGMSSILVRISEYKGAYLWCVGSDTECYFMNKKGVVFSPAPYFSGSAYIKIFSPGNPAEKKVFPFSPLTDAQFALLEKTILLLEPLDIRPTQYTFVEKHSLEITFAHESGQSILYVDPSADISVQLDALASALKTPALANLYKNKEKRLRYLDTRFESKVVYKFE